MKPAKYKPLAMSRAQYERDYGAFGSELFYGVPSTFRDDIETRLANPERSWVRAYEEQAGFQAFMWRNAAAFLDIAEGFTKHLILRKTPAFSERDALVQLERRDRSKAKRNERLESIVAFAWSMRNDYEPLTESARAWFYRVCAHAVRA